MIHSYDDLLFLADHTPAILITDDGSPFCQCDDRGTWQTMLYHEAGHAVASIALGGHCDRLEVSKEALRGWAYCPMEGLPQRLYKLMVLSGPVAEWRARGKRHGVIASGKDWLDLVNDGWSDEMISGLVAESKALTLRYWGVIIRVSEALGRELLLDGEEVHRIYNKHS